MLTKSVISIALLTAGTVVALNAGPALAKPHGSGPTGRTGGIRAVYDQRHTITSPTHGGGGGHHGSGKRADCPPTVACLTVGNNNVPAAAPVRTVDVAFEARDQLYLPVPTVSTFPRNRTYVALRTGLMVGDDEYAQQKKSVTDGDTTVTAIGDPKYVTWNMGESTVTCHSQGSEDGKACGYTYQRSSAAQPNARYPVTVTITWYVHWTCAGVCDQEAGDWGDNSMMSKTTTTTLAVGEVQTESRPG
jgi:hypothetical protein